VQEIHVKQQARPTSVCQCGWAHAVKRAADIIVALIGIVVMSPALAAVGAMIWVTMGGPVLFRQVRPGRYGKPFALWKFRTMLASCDNNGKLMPDAQRLTRLGLWLRATSVDELPQLWPVLRGEMSLVGPRPLLMEYLPRYSPDQARRHEVMPGITGWAQIKGRNALYWDEKVALDTWYVDHWSLWLDAKILFKTFGMVLRRNGISNGSHATMPEFMGICAASGMNSDSEKATEQ
jgi:sugar transferase EpsL